MLLPPVPAAVLQSDKSVQSLRASQPSPAAFSDNLTDQSSDKESGAGSQTDLRKIPSLPAPSDFLSNVGGGGPVPKLMTPDAFMTPTTSVGRAVKCLIINITYVK